MLQLTPPSEARGREGRRGEVRVRTGKHKEEKRRGRGRIKEGKKEGRKDIVEREVGNYMILPETPRSSPFPCTYLSSSFLPPSLPITCTLLFSSLPLTFPLPFPSPSLFPSPHLPTSLLLSTTCQEVFSATKGGGRGKKWTRNDRQKFHLGLRNSDWTLLFPPSAGV